MSPELATFIDARCKGLGLSANELARRTGIPRSTLTTYRRRLPVVVGLAPDRASRLAEVLGVSVLEVLAAAGYPVAVS